MENKKEEIIYYGLVGRVRVQGRSYEEFTLNYLKELVNQNKKIESLKDRLKSYIQYFVDNFSYDKKERDRVLKEYETGSTETTDKNIETLFNLLYNGSGVCQQFSQALALTTMIDEDFVKNDIYVYYATCQISVNDKELGHAINLVSNDRGTTQFVDISSMIHSKEGDFKQDVWSFGMVSQDDYLNNINKENMNIVPIDKESKEVYMVKFKILKDLNAYHLALNLDNNALLANDSELLKGLATKYTVKLLENDLTI